MENLRQIEFRFDESRHHVRLDEDYDEEIIPLLDFIRLSTRVRSITIPLYFAGFEYREWNSEDDPEYYEL